MVSFPSHLLQGVMRVGGLSTMIEIANEGGRTNFAEFVYHWVFRSSFASDFSSLVLFCFASFYNQ